VLAVLLAAATVLALAGAWARELLYDTDAYVAAVGPLVEDPAVQEAIADQITAQVTQTVDDRLDELPDVVQQALTGPADRLTEFVSDTVTQVVASEEFADAWVAANRTAHEQMAGSLTGQNEVVSVERGQVAIEAEVFVQAGKDGLDAAGLGVVADLLPSVDGRFVVLQSDALGLVQAAARLLDAVGAWMWLVAVGLAVAVVLLAPRPHEGVMVAGAAVLVGVALLAGLVLAARRAYLASTGLLPEQAKQVIYDRLTTPLRADLLLVGAGAAAAVLLVWVIGRVATGRTQASGRESNGPAQVTTEPRAP
jgi:hypothetical protein